MNLETIVRKTNKKQIKKEKKCIINCVTLIEAFLLPSFVCFNYSYTSAARFSE